MGVITRLLITTKTTKLCLVSGTESCGVKMDFSTNWLIMKAEKTLENDTDLSPDSPHPVLNMQLADFLLWTCICMCI